jgi:hypothetical protein
MEIGLRIRRLTRPDAKDPQARPFPEDHAAVGLDRHQADLAFSLPRGIALSFKGPALRELRRFAADRSRFYQRFHRGLESWLLTELPVLTRSQLMESFDELVTDPSIHLADLRTFLSQLEGYRLFQDRSWVARTSGSTGNPGIFLWNREEWTTVIASYARAQDWPASPRISLGAPALASSARGCRGINRRWSA